MSEGVKGPGGEFLSASALEDSFGHAQLGGVAPLITNLISSKLGCKCHWAVPDYLQRSARHIASETDVQQAYAVGRAAVEFAIAGKNSVMPAIRRLSDAPYRWDSLRVPSVRQNSALNAGAIRARTTRGIPAEKPVNSYLFQDPGPASR